MERPNPFLDDVEPEVQNLPEEKEESGSSLTREALGFVPGVGTALDVADVAKDVERGDYVGAGIGAAVTALGLIPGAGRLAGNALKFATKSFRKTDAAEAQKLMDSKESMEAWRKSPDNLLPESQRQANKEVTERAAEELFQGTKTSKEVRDIIKDELPITSIYTKDTFPDMPTVTEAVGALGPKAARYGFIGVKDFDLKQGQLVGARLDIPAYNEYDKWVVSLHKGDTPSGSVVGYAQAIKLKDVVFTSRSKTALSIARREVTKTDPETGKALRRMGKTTIARAAGKYQKEDPYKIQQEAYKLIDDPEWTQVGMNPYRASHFYNKVTGEPVFGAKEVIQVGPLVLAKGLKKPTLTQMKKFYGGDKDPKTGLYRGVARTKDGKVRIFNKGGDIMEQQMEMAFMNEGGVLKDDGMRKDPVSGNDVPSGSMAKEVRDDIPAQLSEGEYVVPADVVRFHGVQKFEELRNQAKKGFGSMEADGRIGGQPVDDDFPIPVDQLQTYDEGGDVDTYEEAFGQPFEAGQRYGSTLAPKGQGFELVTYTSPDGSRTIVIPHYNGKPMSAVPSGFTESGGGSGGGTGVADPMADERDRQEREAELARATGTGQPATDMSVLQDQSEPLTKPVEEYDAGDYINFYNDSQDGGLDALLRNTPVIGGVLGMQYRNIRDDAANKLRGGQLGDIDQTQFQDILKFVTTPQTAAGMLGFGRKEEQPNKDLLEYTIEKYRENRRNAPTPDAVYLDSLLKDQAGVELTMPTIDKYIEDMGKDSMFKGNLAKTATKLMLGIRKDKDGNPVINTKEGGKDTPVTPEVLKRLDNNVKVHDKIEQNIQKEDENRMSRGEGPMSVQERFERHHEQFTGFTSSGEFVPGLRQEVSSAPQNIGGGGAFPTYDFDRGGAQNRGGLIGKPKTKKRTTKKGLGVKTKAT